MISTHFLVALVKEQYEIPAQLQAKVMRIGVNHTYLLEATKAKYILRVYTKG